MNSLAVVIKNNLLVNGLNVIIVILVILLVLLLVKVIVSNKK